MLTSWLSLYNQTPENIIEILNEYILFNTYIKINNKMVTNKFIKDNQNQNLKILDLLDNNGNFLPYGILTVNYNITVMNYNSIITVIPHKWKTI